MVVAKTFEALNERFGTNLTSRVAFATELHQDLGYRNKKYDILVSYVVISVFFIYIYVYIHLSTHWYDTFLSSTNHRIQQIYTRIVKEKRNFIQKAHAGQIDHLFSDVKDLATGKAHCDIHNCECSLPHVDMLISGPACTSISGERISNAEFATCYSTGAGASGVTYQSGFRDMISMANPVLSLYENVKTVSERILAYHGCKTNRETRASLKTVEIKRFQRES